MVVHLSQKIPEPRVTSNTLVVLTPPTFAIEAATIKKRMRTHNFKLSCGSRLMPDVSDEGPSCTTAKNEQLKNKIMLLVLDALISCRYSFYVYRQGASPFNDIGLPNAYLMVLETRTLERTLEQIQSDKKQPTSPTPSNSKIGVG